MAIWQLGLHLVRKDGSKPICLNTDALCRLFPEQKSWCSEAKQFGAIDSTCLEIFPEEDMSLRLDLRSLTRNQLEGIIDFVSANGLALEYHGKVYEPSYDNFAIIIKNSDACRFVSAPEEYLRKLRE